MGRLSWGQTYKFAGAAGYTPAQVKEMSLWEFNMIVRGKIAASGDGEEGGTARPPSEDEFFAAVEQAMK